MHGLLVKSMLSPRLDATPIKRATSATLGLKAIHSSRLFVSPLHSEPGYNTPITNATAAAAKRIVYAIREETEEKKKKSHLHYTTHAIHDSSA